MAPAKQQNFIFWMKAIGMLLIVIGHVIGDAEHIFNAVSAPIYSKQLGVAFFIFIAGWGLAQNTRPRPMAAYQRLFAILFYGAACAVLMSVITWVQIQDIAESNYTPLVLGVNVFFNNFPANPTTWYIGMYLHLILLWWWLVPKRLTPLYVLIAVLAELVVRAWLLDAGRPFTAYMLVTNWLSVFLLGYLMAPMGDRPGAKRGMLALGAWLVLLGLWKLSSAPIALDEGFPIRLPGDGLSSAFLASLMVSAVYLANTVLAFLTFRSFTAPWVVHFVARNTLLIFILHMPLIKALVPLVYPLVEPVWLKKLLMIVIILVGLGLFSELVNRLIPVNKFRDWGWRLLGNRFARSASG